MILITRKKYYKMVNEFNKLETSQQVIDYYPKMFEAICIYNFRLPKRIINSMFKNLCYGNWKRLWETDEEHKKTVAALCDDLRWEVFYCSDRMSWDRLIRTHWIWQCIKLRLDLNQDSFEIKEG